MTALQRAIDVSRTRDGTAPAQHVDLGVRWLCGDKVVLQVGGQWDIAQKTWTGESEQFVDVQLHAGQAAAARAWADWLDRHIQYLALRRAGRMAAEARAEAFGNQPPTYLWHLYGGRKAGKTFLAVACLFSYALAVPGSVVLALSPKLDFNTELRATLDAMVPSAWRATGGGKVHLANGSVVWFYTGGIGSEVKLGDVSLALLNEAQSCRESAYLDMRGNASTTGGAVIAAYNPPRTKAGTWLTQVWKNCVEGKDANAQEFFFDPRDNPHSDDHALSSIGYDERTYRIDVLGDMATPPEPVVFPLFMVQRHVRLLVPPEWRDVTAYYCGRRLQHRASWIGGLDFDKGAGCSWVLARIYERQRGDHVVLVHAGHREQDYVETQLSDRLSTALSRRGIAREQVVWVADASSAWQSTTERGADGLTSWKLLQRAGWRQLVPPCPHSKRNPQPSIRRYDLARDLIRRDALHVLDEATEVIDNLVYLPTLKGTQERNRKDDRVHLMDALTYMVYRCLSEGELEIVTTESRPRAHRAQGPASATAGYGPAIQ